MDKLISVIIPYYNTKDYIKNCVDSILNQTYNHLEIIIVNDGSDVESKKYLYDLYGSNPKINIIDKENGGVSSARNVGLEYITGDYISFVDSDDTINLTMYEEMIKEFNEEVDVVCCKTNRIDLNNNIIPCCFGTKDRYFTPEEALNSCLLDNEIKFAVYDKLYKTILFKNSGVKFPDGKTMEEAAILPYIFQKTKKIKFICLSGYNYFVRQNSYTTKVLSEECYNIFDMIKNYRENIVKMYPNIEKSINSYENRTITYLYRTARVQKKMMKIEVYSTIFKQFKRIWLKAFFNEGNFKFKLLVLDTKLGLYLMRRKYREERKRIVS